MSDNDIDERETKRKEVIMLIDILYLFKRGYAMRMAKPALRYYGTRENRTLLRYHVSIPEITELTKQRQTYRMAKSKKRKSRGGERKQKEWGKKETERVGEKWKEWKIRIHICLEKRES